jgi:hypothetical protein
LQLPHFGFQIFVRYEQRLHSVARVTAARRNRLVRRGFEPVRVRL